MLFITDKENKVVFGWSAKCGCTHVKNMFWYLKENIENHKLHIQCEYEKLPDDVENYTVIVFIRNPYERLVSGFLNTGIWLYNWKEPTTTFTKFVNELITHNWDQIDRHHFTPQTSEFYHHELLSKSKKLILYDIKNIDYENIEKIYNKKIPQSVRDFKGDHYQKTTTLMEKPVYDLELNEYKEYKVPTRFFYNQDIQSRVYHFYNYDFRYFKEHGFDYSLN